MPSHFLRASLLCALGLGCASAPVRPTSAVSAPVEPPSIAADNTDEKVEALFAREGEGLAPQQVRWGERTLTFEAIEPPILEEEERTFTAHIPIGADSPLSCTLLAEPSPPGRLLGRATHLGGDTPVRSQLLAVEVVAEQPVLFFETLQRHEEGGMGYLKVAVVRTPEGALLCLHGEPGYMQTFRRVVTGAAASVLATFPAATSHFVEVQRLTLDGLPVGFERREAFPSGTGTKVDLDALFLTPLESGGIHTQDIVVTQDVDAAGTVSRERYGRLEDGELVLGVHLQRTEGQRYRYQGRSEGRELQGEFTTEEGLASESLEARHIRESLLTGKVEQLRFHVYSPAMSLEGPTDNLYQRDPARGPRAVRNRQGSAAYQGLVDAHGQPEWMQALEAPNLEHTRVMARGAP